MYQSPANIKAVQRRVVKTWITSRFSIRINVYFVGSEEKHTLLRWKATIGQTAYCAQL